MSDPYKDAWRRMLRAGARSWRADPRYITPITLTVRQAILFRLQSLCSGVVIGVAALIGAMAMCGLRPASQADVRLAAIMRAAVPDVNSLSQDDLVARLAIPRAVGEMLAPLAATDPARTTIEPPSWLGGFRNGPPVVTTAERMRDLGTMATTLTPMPEQDRSDLITSLIDLYRATRDPSSRRVIGVVAALPRAQRESLAESDALGPLLAAIANLPAATQQALADGRLQLLPDDPERLHLVQSIPRLEPIAVRLINRMAGLTDPILRQAVIYIIDQVCSGSPQILRLLTAYWYREPALMAALAAAPSENKPRPGHAR